MANREVKAKIRAHEKALTAGKAGYAKADELLQELQQLLIVGNPVDIGNGQRAVLVDQFHEKHKVWKPCGVSRYKLDVKQVA